MKDTLGVTGGFAYWDILVNNQANTANSQTVFITDSATYVAAVSSTHDEREFDAAVMRTLGASSRQLRAVQAAEFALIGALAGLLAAVGATGIGYVLADRVLNLPYAINPWVWLAGLLIGAAGVTVAGLLGTAKVLRTPPMQVFRASA